MFDTQPGRSWIRILLAESRKQPRSLSHRSGRAVTEAAGTSRSSKTTPSPVDGGTCAWLYSKPLLTNSWRSCSSALLCRQRRSKADRASLHRCESLEPAEWKGFPNKAADSRSSGFNAPPLPELQHSLHSGAADRRWSNLRPLFHVSDPKS